MRKGNDHLPANQSRVNSELFPVHDKTLSGDSIYCAIMAVLQ